MSKIDFTALQASISAAREAMNAHFDKTKELLRECESSLKSGDIDRARKLAVEVNDRLYNLGVDCLDGLEEVVWEGAEEEHERYLAVRHIAQKEAEEEEG